MTVRHLSLGAVALVVVAALVATYQRPVVVVLGLVAILVAPGLALAFALRLLPARTAGRSAVLVLAALPVGLTATSAPLTLGAVTIVLAAAAVFRRPAGERITLPHPSLRPGANAALLGVAALVAVAALVVAHVADARYDHTNQATQLSLVPRSGGRAVEVAVENHQAEDTTFRVEVSAARVLTSRTVRVAKDDATRFTMTLPAGVTATTVRASLFEPGRAAALRTVGTAG